MRARGGTGALAALVLAGVLDSAHGELQACTQALSLLMTAPYNASLPFMNGVTGRVNVAYLYQKPPLAILPNEMLGNYDLCNNADTYIPGMISTHYCTVGGDRGGVCVPSQCTAEDLHSPGFMMPLLNLGMSAVQEVPLTCFIDPYMTKNCAWSRQAWEYYTALYNMVALLGQNTPMNKGRVTCATRPPPANGSNYAMIVVLCALTALAIAGGLWRYWHRRFLAVVKAREAELAAAPSEESKDQLALHVQKTPAARSPGMPGFREIPLEETKAPEGARVAGPQTATYTPYCSFPACPEWLACFSLTDNWRETFAVKARAGEFACFDAMKAISAAWVVFYHVILWMTYYIDNPEYLIPPNGLLGQWWAVPFFNYSGTLSVDTFFFISAFLATYMLLTKLDREEANGNAKPAYKWVPLLYLHRYLRITPAYALAFFIHWKIAPLFAYGPISKGVWAINTKPCNNTWWAHFLYINDIYPWWNQRYGQICYGHSWYLANDMQYFLLVPFLVMLFRSPKRVYRRMSVCLVFGCLMACIIASGVLATVNKWSPNSWDGAAGIRYMEEGFPRPWTRCSSYMIGIMFAFLWYNKKTYQPDEKFSWAKANLLWLTGLLLLCLAMYGPFHGSQGVLPCNLPGIGATCGSDWSQATRSAIIALLRPTWTLGLGLLCMLCWNNQGGLIQQFLSAPGWLPLSNLSFAVYLVHYTVLTFYIGQRAVRIRFDLFIFLTTFIGLLAISTGLAVVVVMLAEKPGMKLQRLLLEGKRRGQAGAQTAK